MKKPIKRSIRVPAGGGTKRRRLGPIGSDPQNAPQTEGVQKVIHQPAPASEIGPIKDKLEKEGAETMTAKNLNEVGAIPKDVIEHLKLREGWREKVYLDTLGFPTAGMGHLLTTTEKAKYPVGAVVPKATLEGWVRADSRKAYNAALAQAKTLGISDKKFIVVLTSVNFQLGSAWNTIHKKTWAFMVARKWEKAAVEAQDSKWYRQTPVRVKDFQAALRALIKKKVD